MKGCSEQWPFLFSKKKIFAGKILDPIHARVILVVKGFSFKWDQACQQNCVSFHHSGLEIEFGKSLKWCFKIQAMTFWPLVFHILIFLFLKTKLHRDLLVEGTGTQTYIMWEQIGSICELKRLQRKGPYEEKNWKFVVKWNAVCAIYFVYTDLCWLSHQIDWLSDLESNCSQVPDLETDLPSWIPGNVPTKAHHSRSEPSALLISLFAPSTESVF